MRLHPGQRLPGDLYIGVTTDLARRMSEHRDAGRESFVGRYDARRLVYAEHHDRIDDAIRREKHLKRWRRAWKIRLIEEANPDWRDLFDQII
ncbi:GIY-YIG nuclease family protein [Tistrella mobilis]